MMHLICYNIFFQEILVKNTLVLLNFVHECYISHTLKANLPSPQKKNQGFLYLLQNKKLHYILSMLSFNLITFKRL